MIKRLLVPFSVLSIFISSFASADTSPTASIFNPATDMGRYLNTRQSETLRQFRFASGLYFDYARNPIRVDTGTGIQRVVGNLSIMHAVGSFAFTNWFQMGADIPLAIYETYSNPNSLLGAAAPVEKFAGKMGDVKLDATFRVLDINRYNIGVAISPYAQFPTAKKDIYLGNQQFSGGGRVIVEGKIKDRAWIAMNVGFQALKRVQYFTANTDAIIGNQLLASLGANVNIAKGVSVLGEAYVQTLASNAFKSSRQTPAEALLGVRFTIPKGAAEGMMFTLAGGSGFGSGVGAPRGHGMLSVGYRQPYRVPTLTPALVDARADEKILITQKIHFEFNRAIIRPISYPILDDVVNLLKLNPQIKKIQVEGHTDAIGGDAGNMRLSDARAKSVVAYLVSKGVPSSRLVAVGYGRSRPIADNSTAEGRAKNRRTEFTVIE